MKCENCGKQFATKDCVHILKGKKSVPITFCSYTCYIAFWSECPNFDPFLLDYKPKSWSNQTQTKEERQ